MDSVVAPEPCEIIIRWRCSVCGKVKESLIFCHRGAEMFIPRSGWDTSWGLQICEEHKIDGSRIVIDGKELKSVVPTDTGWPRLEFMESHA